MTLGKHAEKHVTPTSLVTMNLLLLLMNHMVLTAYRCVTPLIVLYHNTRATYLIPTRLDLHETEDLTLLDILIDLLLTM